ncbi:amidase [Actinobacteria bacterium YIM 96077]|uniref:Amidase n=1 Tax=Phytoactinopolyspora halophila TaxID=1981511 RepID=A0A329QPE1_9ACTN|nr:amidase [Phytoactinopolyspora halophila]AYY12958.1 amidase [Actinobacteria bacterium YIM 96077]RAW13222.1 amidase [Phytoactinopolyspora halophila]
MSADLPGRTLAELIGLLRAGTVSASELASACLDAVAAREDDLRAWAHLDPDAAMARARELDAVPAGERGPLHGIPVGIKDIIDTADLPTEYGSPIYAGHHPAEDADVVARLRRAGAIILGKTVTTEFALFHPGATTNPHDPARTPGGSSSGSAAAVGAGTVPLALGTQTAGSIVRPASYCGVVGVKPTFGRVSTRGVKACSRSLDTIGTFTRDVDGADAVLRVLGGVDANDPEPAAGALAAGRALRVGFARTPEWHEVPADSRGRIEQAVQKVAAGFGVRDVELPEAFSGLVEAQKCLMLVEVTRELADERAHHGDQLSTRLQDVLAHGDRMTWAYEAAKAHVRHCRGLLDDVFGDVDVLLAPSVLGEAPPIDEGTGDPVLCRAWTALGTPAVAVPGLTGPAGLPLGVQVVAAPGRDDLALEGARQLGRSLRDREHLSSHVAR